MITTIIFFFYINIYKKANLLYNQKANEKKKRKNQKYKTDTKFLLTFLSVKDACGGMLQIETMPSTYQTLSLKANI